MATLQFRGAELRAWTGKIEEDGPIHRLKFLADLSRPAARDLGCEDLFFDGDSEKIRESPVAISVKRTLRAESFKITPNGMQQHTLELDAQALECELYTVQGKEEDDPPEGHIRLSITAGKVFGPVERYVKAVGTGAGVLRVKLNGDGQMKLGEEAEAESEEAEEAHPAPLASFGDMGETTRKRGRPRKEDPIEEA